MLMALNVTLMNCTTSSESCLDFNAIWITETFNRMIQNLTRMLIFKLHKRNRWCCYLY